MAHRILVALTKFLAFMGLAVVLLTPSVAIAAGDQPTGPVPGRFIVKLKPGAKVDQAAKALSSNQSLERLTALQMSPSKKGGEVFARYYSLVDGDQTLSANQVASHLGSHLVESVEPDYYLEFFDFPTDEFFPHQWYLNNTGQEYFGIERVEGPFNDTLRLSSGVVGADINIAPEYVTQPTEATRVVVAIIDSGVDTDHPELTGNIWVNTDEIPNNGIDDDHNGYVDDTAGYDMSGDLQSIFTIYPDNDPTDEVGHGSHCAGIVAAKNDGVGIVGVAPKALIMPIKIQPNAFASVGASGIIYAVNSGARVINISWGTPFESAVLRDALRFARDNGVFVAIAPGNTGDNQRFFPAAFDSSFVVAAGNSQGLQAEWSTFGSHIDIVAPGRDILSIRADSTDMYADADEPLVRIVGDEGLFYLSDGTSMAAPVVAGAAAYILGERPEIPLDVLEEVLLLGADDLVDPYGIGDSLPGPDTISGWGYINVYNSLQLLGNGGVAFASPSRRHRYLSSIPIKALPIGGYSGSWTLEYAHGLGSEDWIFLATGNDIPADSILYVFDDMTAQGNLRFRLTDMYGSHSVTSCAHVRSRRVQIDSPSPGQELQYNVPIYGSAFGPDFDSMMVTFRKGSSAVSLIAKSTGEFYDSLLHDWTVSGADTGSFTVYVHGFFGSETLRDSVWVRVSSAFAQGWPANIGGIGAISPVCDDLDGNGSKELVVGTSRGLYVIGNDGTIMPGFPVLTNKNMRCVPAVYDTDRDGFKEIVATNEDGIHVFNHDGTYADGWPVLCITGRIPSGYGYPNPTITRLGMFEDSAIVILNRIGQILAYEFNGDSYFYSLDGLFTSLDPRISSFAAYGGSTSPMVSAVDLNRDGQQEVIASYTSPYPYTGLALFDGRTGQPAYDMLSPIVQTVVDLRGSVVTDMDGDDMFEVATLGTDTTNIPKMWVKEEDGTDMAGWPVTFPALANWIGSYPVAADLDLDGIPEILFTFFAYDVAALYILNSDGTSYIEREGRPTGETFTDNVTFGTPMVADLTGDEYPEIIFRSGHILPGTGREKLYILDHRAQPLEGWPVTTPASPSTVFSSRFAPLVDDLDGDDLVELIVVSDNETVLVWDFDAEFQDGSNRTKFLVDNVNSSVMKTLGGPTDVEDGPPALPRGFELSQNYPNPFNPSTVIQFTLPRRSEVQLEVFNVLGQRVVTLEEGELEAGPHQVVFDGANLASGVYLYRLKTADQVATKKMVLLK